MDWKAECDQLNLAHETKQRRIAHQKLLWLYDTIQQEYNGERFMS